MRWIPSVKQYEAFQYLLDKQSTEILYGGGAGGGKSYLGCVWLLYSCLQYPGTRWLMGRAILKTLKDSTLLTFFRVCREWGLRMNKDFKYNSIDATIKFPNESVIHLKDLFNYPSDPEFDELGSTEYTGAFIDEASQITHKAYQIVMSRIRYRLDEYQLVPKILVATNPTKNFLYAEFYKASKEGTLPIYRKFVPALVQDNPFISRHYIDNLNKLDKISKERLLFGNWEYDDDPTKLFDYECLLDMFNKPYLEKPREQKYITADIARFGEDSTVIVVWRDLHVEKIIHAKKQSTMETANKIRQVAEQEGVPNHLIAIDEDGVGGGVVDQFNGVRGFVNNSKALEQLGKEAQANYANLKSQCYFIFAELVNTNQIGIYKSVDNEVKKRIIEDLEQIKRHNADKDAKLQVTPKEEVKEHLGRSPDFGDALMMRMIFLLKRPYTPYISALSKHR